MIFLDLPVVFDRTLVEAMPFTWQPEYGARLGVARSDGNRIVVYAVRYPHLNAPDLDRSGQRHGHRGAARRSGRGVPRVDDRLAGRESRCGHLITASGLGSERPSALLRYDLATGTIGRHEFGPGRHAAEAAFAPAEVARLADHLRLRRRFRHQ